MKLTERGLQILYAVHDIQHDTQLPVDGPQLLERFQRSTLVDATNISTEGLHQSAATLVRHGLLRKYHRTPVRYELLDEGRAELARQLDKKPRPL